MVVNYNFVFFSNNEVIQKKNLVKDQTHLLVALTEMQSHCTIVNTTNKNDNPKKEKHGSSTWLLITHLKTISFNVKIMIPYCRNSISILQFH